MKKTEKTKSTKKPVAKKTVKKTVKPAPKKVAKKPVKKPAKKTKPDASMVVVTFFVRIGSAHSFDEIKFNVAPKLTEKQGKAMARRITKALANNFDECLNEVL